MTTYATYIMDVGETVMLDHNSIVPLYKQISNQIQNDIRAGMFAENKRLPTEGVLADTYHVSRITIRRAVSELVEMELVEKKQGKGTFIREPKMLKDFKRPATSFTDMCWLNGKRASAKVLEAGIVVPSAGILEQMELPPEERVVRIYRLRYADGMPLVLEDNYFPLKFSYLLTEDFNDDSIYRYLREEKMINILPGSLRLRISRPTSKEARLLEITRREPVLRMNGTIYCDDGELLHICEQIGYGENFDFIIR